MSGRLVAAMMTMPSDVSKPSISASNWLSVCSRSSWPPPRPAPRLRPIESISSTKMIARPIRRACWNRSRTRLAPTPTNISMKSEPVTRQEADAGLAGDGAGEQRLAGAGRADEQDALGDPSADLAEPLGHPQEVDDLGDLLLDARRSRRCRRTWWTACRCCRPWRGCARSTSRCPSGRRHDAASRRRTR